jgi:hypothetical protein
MKTFLIKSTAIALLMMATLQTTGQKSLFTKVYYDQFIHAQGYGIAGTSDGGYMIVGNRNGNPMVMKISSDGSIEWMKQEPALGYGLYSCIDTKNGDTCWIAGMAPDPSGQGNSIICRKLTSIGDTLFSKRYQVTTSAVVQTLSVTADGGTVMCGFTEESFLNPSGMFILKTDADGNIEWNRILKVNQGICWAHSIRQTSNGGYILTGTTVVTNPAYHKNTILVRMNADGSLRWSKKFVGGPGSGNSDGYDALEISDNFHLLLRDESYPQLMIIPVDTIGIPSTGKLFNTTATGAMEYGTSTPKLRACSSGGYAFINHGWGWDDMIIKVDAQGNFKWNTYLQLMTSDLVETSDHGFMVLGNGPIYGVFMGPTDKQQIGIIKTDSLGNASSCSYGGQLIPDTATVTAQDIVLTVSSVIPVVGSIPAWENTSLLIYDGCVAVTGAVNERSPVETTLSVSPNPAGQYVMIDCSPSGSGGLTEGLRIYDSKGTLVFKRSENLSFPFSIDVTQFTHGIYMIMTTDRGKVISAKLSVAR